jgi:hypothetical protein
VPGQTSNYEQAKAKSGLSKRYGGCGQTLPQPPSPQIIKIENASARRRVIQLQNETAEATLFYQGAR